MNCSKYSLLRKPHRQHRPASGFTIVELLVVIVVIGILAAITIVSYTGIAQKAVLASLQSDLSGSANKLKMYSVEHGAFPASLDSSYCPKDSTGAVDARYCLKASPGNNLSYGSSSPYGTFSLTATNTNGTSYQVTDNSQPTALAAAPLSPVADWLATAQGDHYGNYYDLVNHGWASVTRTTPKTIYDPNDGRIHDVPAGYLAMNPWSAYQSGGRGSAAVIEETRTNYLTNSHGAANTNGLWDDWGTGGNPSTIVAGIYGSTALRIQKSDMSSEVNLSHNMANGVLVAGDSVAQSIWGRSASSNCESRIRIVAVNAAGGYLGTLNGMILPNDSEWHRITALWTALPANTARVIFEVNNYQTVAGGSLDVAFDAAQLEKGSFATSYIPTTTAAATRDADVVTIPTTGWNAAAGTIVAVGESRNGIGEAYMLSVGVYEQNLLRVGSGGEGLYDTIVINGGWSDSYVNGSGVGVHAFAYGPATQTSYWNGTAGSPRASVVLPSMGQPAYMGQDLSSSSKFANGPIHRATVYSSALSPSDVTTVTNAVKNGP